MITAVKLFYVGKTPKLTISRKELSRPYVFDKETGGVAVVSHDDAKILLERAGSSFKVVSGAFTVDESTFEPVEVLGPMEPTVEKQPSLPTPEETPLDDMTDEMPDEFVLTGDGIEGTEDLPTVEPGTTKEQGLTKKKGGRK